MPRKFPDFAGLVQEVRTLQGDRRVKDWWLMESPWPSVVVTVIYLYGCTRWAPKYMEYKKPYKLKETMMIYNAFQAAFSFWMFWETLNGGWLTSYNINCQPVDVSDRPEALRMATAYWWFFFSKFIDFLDTIFFIMRKKFHQVSHLHLIHHCIMPTACWYGVKYVPGGQAAFLTLLNTFVHTIMYSYYLLAAMGPQYQKYLWWKKYLTIMQMVQFVAVIIHACQLFFIDCDFPIAFAWWCLFSASLFFILFANYYIQSYLKPKKKVSAVENLSSKESIEESCRPIHHKKDSKENEVETEQKKMK